MTSRWEDTTAAAKPAAAKPAAGENRFDLILLGDPVAQSRSPIMHRAVLEVCGLSGSYEARQVDEIGMVEAAAELRSGALQGANITMPHKVVAAALSDRLSDDARRAGSVNTWVMTDGALCGHSTDVIGVRRLLDRLPDGPVTVLGSGGAAAAALIALGGRTTDLRSRSQANAQRLLRSIGLDGNSGRWEDPIQPSIVVNCTPIGMKSGDRLPDRFLSGAIGLLEMAYGQSETNAIAAARANDIPYTDGIDLLVAQAEESFRLWTTHEVPVGVMERAARSQSSGTKLE